MENEKLINKQTKKICKILCKGCLVRKYCKTHRYLSYSSCEFELMEQIKDFIQDLREENYND